MKGIIKLDMELELEGEGRGSGLKDLYLLYHYHSARTMTKAKAKAVRISKPEIVEPSAWQPTDALTHISQTKDKGHWKKELS